MRSLHFDNLPYVSFFSKDVFVLRNKDTFVLKKCQNSDISEDIKNIFLVTRFILSLKIDVSSLQRPLKTCYTIFFLSFYWTLNIRVKLQNVRISWIFVFNFDVQNSIKEQKIIAQQRVDLKERLWSSRLR